MGKIKERDRMENQIKFAKNVLLLDVAFIHGMLGRIRQFMSERLGRQLPDIDLSAWLTCLVLDAGIRGDKNEVQVLLLHDGEEQRVDFCQPSDLKSLDGMACRTSLGEFAFSCVTSADIVSSEALFVDLMTLALDSSDVKCLMLLPCHEKYASLLEKEICSLLDGKEKEMTEKLLYFTMAGSMSPLPCRCDSVVHSLIRVWDIRPEELKPL